MAPRSVGGIGVDVGGTGVAVGLGVEVGGTGVLVGGMGVGVGGTGVSVGGNRVDVSTIAVTTVSTTSAVGMGVALGPVGIRARMPTTASTTTRKTAATRAPTGIRRQGD